MKIDNVLKEVAIENGYNDKLEMLRAYGIIPSVLPVKHKKTEFIALLLKTFIKK